MILKKCTFTRKKFVGAVLIEFAFAVPVLVIILYFCLDVPLAYRVSSKLYRISEFYAQMLINTAKQKRIITVNDLKNISRSIGLSFTGIIGNRNYPFNLSTYVICIQGKGGNQFEVQWGVHIQNNLGNGDVTSNNTFQYSTIDDKANVHSGNIKSLVIQKGEKKLLIETVAWYSNDSTSRGFNNGFYLLSIPGKVKNSAKTFGDKTAIITPDDYLTEKPT